MVTQIPSSKNIIYPDSDGQPIADNTKQFELIVWLKKKFDLLFANDPNIFVAGDLLWYPVEGNPNLRRAPDVMVAFGKPKGDRGSYKQWEEDNIPPQVVFEILSPGNTFREMTEKYKFYQRYGVEEYYLYNPDTAELSGWLRSNQELTEITEMLNWVSPRLQIRFDLVERELVTYRPDGQKFLTYLEIDQQRQEAEARVEEERQRADTERDRAQQAEAQLQALRTFLEQRGINPD